MSTNRYPPHERAALAALATHTGWEPVAEAAGVKDSTVREWMRRQDLHRSWLVPADDDVLAFLREFAQRLAEEDHQAYAKIAEGLTSIIGASDHLALVNAVVRDGSLFSLDRQREPWNTNFGKAILASIGPYDQFLAEPSQHMREIDFARLGNAYLWTYDLASEFSLLPDIDPDWLQQIKLGHQPAEALASCSAEDPTAATGLDVEAAANLADRTRERSNAVIGALPYLSDLFSHWHEA